MTWLRPPRRLPVGATIAFGPLLALDRKTSPKGWEDAAKVAIATAARTLRDLRVAEVVAQDITTSESDEVEGFRTKLRLSFKYEAPLGAPEWEGEKAKAHA